MGIKTYRPTTKTRRFQTTVTREEITTDRPHAPLVEKLSKSGGRNNTGQLTSWFRGGGHKRRYRKIDFKRDKVGVPAKVASIEYDPNRSANIALLHYNDGEKRYILQPVGLKVGMTIVAGEGADILVGNALPLRLIPPGTLVHNVELRPGKGGQMGRAAGAEIRLVSKEADYALLKLPFGRSAPRVDGLHGDGRLGRQRRSRQREARQGGTRALAGQPPAQPRRHDESGRPPARRRRGPHLRRPSPGHALGTAYARV